MSVDKLLWYDHSNETLCQLLHNARFLAYYKTKFEKFVDFCSGGESVKVAIKRTLFSPPPSAPSDAITLFRSKKI